MKEKLKKSRIEFRVFEDLKMDILAICKIDNTSLTKLITNYLEEVRRKNKSKYTTV